MEKGKTTAIIGGTGSGKSTSLYSFLNEVNKIVNITISNAEAEAAKLIAEGEAEYMRMLAEAYNSQEKKDFYEFTLALDALKASLTGEEKTVILDADSDLAKILMGVTG